MPSPTLRTTRAQYAAYTRWRQPDDPALIAAHQDLQAQRLADQIQAALGDLTDEGRASLILLLARGAS